jgi:hypothetical protein
MMASRRCERRKSCEGKKRYGSVAEARSAAWRSRVKSGDHIAEYKCEFCCGWHIGHRSGRKMV